MNINPLDQHRNIMSLTDKFSSFITVNPLVLLVLFIIVFSYVLVFLGTETGITEADPYLQAFSMGTAQPPSDISQPFTFIEILLWVLFFVLMSTNIINYMFKLDIYANIRDIFSPTPKIDIDVINRYKEKAKPPKKKYKKEVFHIPDNKYTFEDSKAICQAYGARLATYDEIKNAHEKGAEWCSYGWSDQQMAFFPTQKKTFDKLQKIEGHEHDCGRPGINGGYIDNPNVRFGVNCFGYKPSMTSKEMVHMENMPLYPKTKKDKELEQRVQYFKDKIHEIRLSPFNKNSWNVV